MTDFKKATAPREIQTHDHNAVDAQTGNIYEAITIIGKRAVAIGEEIKQEIQDKLEEFGINNEMLEEVFENREQIELSRFYESLPKPTAIALQEWLKEKIYFRRPEEEVVNAVLAKAQCS
jgi:DNA-directed RNA polymerase subunit K/omega